MLLLHRLVGLRDVDVGHLGAGLNDPVDAHERELELLRVVPQLRVEVESGSRESERGDENTDSSANNKFSHIIAIILYAALNTTSLTCAWWVRILVMPRHIQTWDVELDYTNSGYATKFTLPFKLDNSLPTFGFLRVVFPFSLHYTATNS